MGVSDGVMSVISDYCRPAPPLLRGYSPDIQRNKFLKLDRCRDTLYAKVLICTLCRKAEQEEELAVYKQQDSLYRALVACLARDGFRLGMDVGF